MKLNALIERLLAELSPSTLSGNQNGRSRGKSGQYPVPDAQKATGSGPVEKQDDMVKIEGKNKGEDLGFGFNEDGYPLQDKYEFQGMPLAIENKKGSKRSWYDEHGDEAGSTKMRWDYGYVDDGSVGSDGDAVDVYVGPDEDAEFVYVVHQMKKPEFADYDEDKVMLGFKDEWDAKKAYLAQYDSPGFYGGMSAMPLEKFKEKLGGNGKKITNEIVARLIESLTEDDKGSMSTDMDDWEQGSTRVDHPDIKIGSLDKPVKAPLAKADEKVGRELIEEFRTLMQTKRHLSIPEHPKMLGVGTKGTAFDIGGGKTLKVTVDDREAVAANKIKQLGELKHIYRVYDVFQFRDTGYFGIVQELLKPMSGLPKSGPQFGDNVSGQAGDFNEALAKLNFWNCVGGAKSWSEVRQRVIDYSQKKAREMPAQGAVKQYLETVNKAWQLVREYGVEQMFKELKSAGVEFHDYHAGNIMQRPNGDWVIIDLGFSKVDGGQQPDVLEKKQVTEGVADSTGVTVGRYQPFHKGHAEIIRGLAQKHTKVIVFVAGLKKDEQNPFSYDLRVEMLRASLPDVEDKVEVYRAENIHGKQTGYVPELVDRIVRDKNSTLEPGVSGNVAVGPDRVDDVKKQIAHALKSKEQDDAVLPGFDPTIFAVETVPALKNDGDTDRVSGTRVREALKKGDKEVVRALLDPHVSSDETKFDDLYGKMRDELGLSKNESIIREDLASAGGPSALMDIARQSGNLLKLRMGIDLEKAKVLGNGQKGVALDVGGGKVLKLTTDEKEAHAAHALEGKATQKIVRIFKVVKFKDKAATETVYAIEQEKVDPLSPDEAREFDAAMKQVNDAEEHGDADGAMTSLAHGDVERMFKFMQVFWAKDARQDMQYPVGSPPNPRKETKLTQVIAQREQMLRKTLEKFQVPEMMAELKKNNVLFADYHAGNIGKKGEGYVVFDLGMSKVEGGTEPPVLERIVRAVMGRLTEWSPPSPTDFASPNARVQSSAWSDGETMTGRTEDDQGEPGLSGSVPGALQASPHDKLTSPGLPPMFEDISFFDRRPNSFVASVLAAVAATAKKR